MSKDKKLEKLARKKLNKGEFKKFVIWYKTIQGERRSVNELLVESIKKAHYEQP